MALLTDLILLAVSARSSVRRSDWRCPVPTP